MTTAMDHGKMVPPVIWPKSLSIFGSEIFSALPCIKVKPQVTLSPCRMGKVLKNLLQRKNARQPRTQNCSSPSRGSIVTRNFEDRFLKLVVHLLNSDGRWLVNYIRSHWATLMCILWCDWFANWIWPSKWTLTLSVFWGDLKKKSVQSVFCRTVRVIIRTHRTQCTPMPGHLMKTSKDFGKLVNWFSATGCS